jgi:hypothetical protein
VLSFLSSDRDELVRPAGRLVDDVFTRTGEELPAPPLIDPTRRSSSRLVHISCASAHAPAAPSADPS